MKIGKYQFFARRDHHGVDVRIAPSVDVDERGNVVSHEGPTFEASAQLDAWEWGAWLSDGAIRIDVAPFHASLRDASFLFLAPLKRLGYVGACVFYDPDSIEPLGLRVRSTFVDVLAAVLGNAECTTTEVERIEGVVVSGPEGFSARATATLEERRYTRSRWPGTWAVYRRVDFVFDEPADVPGFPRPLHDISIVAESIAQGLDKLHEKMFSR